MNNDDQIRFCKEHSLTCEFCKYNSSGDINDCYDCVGDHNAFEPSKTLIQSLNKHGLSIVPNKVKTTIILGFPGVGKSYLKEKCKGGKLTVLDSDSSCFSKDEFPNNYIEYIKSQIGKADIIMCSTHEAVRKAIYEDEYIMKNSKVYICYPELNMQDAWIKRLRDRGNSEEFVSLIEKNYKKWILDIKLENKFFPLVLRYEQDNLANHLYEIDIKI